MDSPTKGPEFNTKIPLKVTISTSTSSTDRISDRQSIDLDISVQNTSPEPVLFLRWLSPLDPKAPAMGLFVFTSIKDGTQATAMNLKISRMLPEGGNYSAEDVVKIDGNGSINQKIAIKSPEVVLERGERYSVVAKGTWLHVKPGDHSTLSTADDNVLRGGFESNIAEIIA
ncbi:hypothetical protein BP6252_03810 [Coleophoma cylindrospora]|uniref:Uncharacterized protein n=1 Tax=Coleophoma cylindrospora TaxID=1849047 RepID=A0A3D8SA67_9HELO|nr:hypothetical protein BP6252_03810 [Coleophoma cylindrospora]